MNNYCVYMHISPSNKKYVGITSMSLERRWKNGKGYADNKHFTRAINKYGWDNFEHIVIAKGLTEDEAKWLEIELIKVNDSANPDKGYNITLGGESASGYHHTEEAKQKISEATKGINNPMYGRTGDDCPMYGKHHSEETKQRLSEINKGKNHPRAKSIICLTTKYIFFTAKDAEKKYGVGSGNITKCCKGTRKSAGKYNGQKLVWKYLNHKHNYKFRMKQA